MSPRPDVVVAGAGHNSLVAAAYLAKAGFEVRVLESRPVVGGNTATEELTLPGFLHDSCSTAHNLIQSSPAVAELGLEEYGLEYLRPDPVVHVPFPDGTSITQWRDLDRTCDELARFSHRDADAYRRLIAEYDAAKSAFGAYRNSPVGRAPRPDEVLDGRWRRRLASSAWDVIRAEFEDWHVRAFMLWMAIMTVQPADRPGTGALAYSLVYGRQHHSWTLPRGGSAALPLALAHLIEDHGGTILCGRRVSSLVLENGRCVGVETEDGERHLATRAVVSTVHPAHLLDMAPREVWGDEWVHTADTWREGVCLFPTHLATTVAPAFPVDGDELAPVASGIAPSVDRLLRLGSDVERGLLADDDPVLLVVCATVADPSRAPEGRHVLKVIGFHPYTLAEGGPDRWDDREGRGRPPEPRAAPPLRAQPHGGDDPRPGREEPTRPRADESAQLARHVPRRRPRPLPVGRAPVRADNPDTGPFPDGRHDPPGRLGLGGSRAEHRDRRARGARQLAGRGDRSGSPCLMRGSRPRSRTGRRASSRRASTSTTSGARLRASKRGRSGCPPGSRRATSTVRSPRRPRPKGSR